MDEKLIDQCKKMHHGSQRRVYELLAPRLSLVCKRYPWEPGRFFCLYAIEGYSHKEIASQLGISEGTSKSQLNVSRTKFRELLEVYYDQTKSYGTS